MTDPDTSEVTDGWRLFHRALADWYDGGPGTVICPNNGSAIAINEWQWQGDWPIAVGHLGFRFWNWPSLQPDFVDQIGDQTPPPRRNRRGKM